MTAYNLIYSNKKSTRITRHVIFWLFILSLASFQQAALRAQFRSYPVWDAIWFSHFEYFLQIIFDIAFCYTVIYFLIPKFLLREKFLEFAIGWILATVITASLNILYLPYVVLPARALIHQPVPEQPNYWYFLLQDSSSLATATGLAALIKLLKTLMFKNREEAPRKGAEEPLREDALSAELYPSFLNSIVGRLAAHLAVDGENGALLSKVKKVLTYAGYRAGKTLVPLSTEIDALSDYLDLQREISSLRSTLDISGQTEDEEITPFILVSIADLFVSHQGVNELAIRTNITRNRLMARYAFPMRGYREKEALAGPLVQIHRQLSHNYPQSFTLTKVLEEDKLFIDISLQLDRTAVPH